MGVPAVFSGVASEQGDGERGSPIRTGRRPWKRSPERVPIAPVRSVASPCTHGQKSLATEGATSAPGSCLLRVFSWPEEGLGGQNGFPQSQLQLQTAALWATFGYGKEPRLSEPEGRGCRPVTPSFLSYLAWRQSWKYPDTQYSARKWGY